MNTICLGRIPVAVDENLPAAPAADKHIIYIIDIIRYSSTVDEYRLK
jgi:hypothetical protein